MRSEKLLDRFFQRFLTRGTLEIVHSDGSERKFGDPAPGFPDVRIRLADEKVARQVLLDPRLGAAEACMDGRLVIEKGGIMELAQIVRANRPWERAEHLASPGLLHRIGNRLAHTMQSINNRKGARRNVAHHYDIGNDLYRLMLDAPHMQYSCAYWPREGMTLEEAQEAKLAHIAAKLALEPGHEVLDIGCGWGGMAIFLAQRADVRVTGVTLSSEQLALAEERAKEAGVADRVSFRLMDYRDLADSGRQFDRIVSVGMFEHVGRPQFETFFRCAANMMKPDAVMLIHTIGRFGGPGSTDAFTRKYIFPGGYIPALSETVAASEKSRLIATDVETLRLHYAYTLREWYARCMANRQEIEAMYDARFFRMWTFYLAGAVSVFENGGMGNYQIQYVRARRSLPIQRNYMAATEKELLSR